MSRPSVDALPAGIVLAVTAIACWSGHATAPAIVTAAAAAVAGAILGESLARGPLRTIPALAVAAAPAVLLPLLGALCERALVLVPPPGPETVLVVVDALEVATLTFSAATGLVLLARRLPLLAPLPVAIVALVAALPLLAHRGGMIHRPRLVAELAWSRGLHPVLLLGAIGAGAAALGLLALARGHDLRGRPADVLLLVALAALLAWILPAAGLLSVPPVDPLGLAREGKEPVPGHGGTGAAPREPMPFRDEVDTSRANVPAAVVLFHDDVVPFDGIYRFRQVAFSSWNGRRLVRGVLPGLVAVAAVHQILPTATFPYYPEGLRFPLFDLSLPLVVTGCAAPRIPRKMSSAGAPCRPRTFGARENTFDMAPNLTRLAHERGESRASWVMRARPRPVSRRSWTSLP